jgi:YVTN family beta-propeller protein
VSHAQLLRRSLIVAGLAMTLAQCRDAFEPGTAARLHVAPILPSRAELADFGLTIDAVRFIAVRPPSDTLADTTVAVPPGATEVALDLRVPVLRNPDTVRVSVLALSGAMPLFSGTQLVPIPTPLPPPEITVDTYLGPAVDSLVVLPNAPFIRFNDSLRFQVLGFNGGAPVSQFYVAWSTSDSGVARIDARGTMRAPATRSTVWVRARTPSGTADSVLATFTPAATQLVSIAGTGQTDTVGNALAIPFEVEARAADGLGVGGVAVRFRSLSGGAPADTAVVSDAAGRAGVIAVLGPTAGAQTFEASLSAFPGVAAVTFDVTAVAGAISAATSRITVSAGTVLSGSEVVLTLQGKDAAGNDVTTGGAAVVFTASGGTSTGTIGATTDDGDGTYSATFTGVTVGTATTIGALIDDVAVTSTPLPSITVVVGVIDSVAVTPPSATLDALSAAQPFAAQAFDINGNPVSSAAFTWATSNGLVASVDSAGLATALANGTVTISATADGVTGAASLTIAQAVASVTVSPQSATLHSLNDTEQFTAHAVDRLGNSLAPQPTFTWSARNTLVARVNQGGLATSLATGLTQIVAASSGVADSADLTVQQVATSVTVTPDRVLLTSVGETVQLTAEALDAGGSPVPGAAFIWSSGNTLAATVDPAGLVTAVADGTSDVIAATAGVQDTAQVTVNLLGAATQLVFIQQPPSPAFFGDTFTVQIAAQDDLGNTVTSFSGLVVLSENAISRNPTSTLQGTLEVAAVNGVATFTDLFVDGTDTTAIDANADGPAPAMSNTFEVVEQIVLQETGAAPYFAGVDTVRNRAYMSNTSGKSATVIDGAVHKAVNTVTGLGTNPGWEGVNSETKQVFISDFLDGVVFVIDQSDDAVVGSIPVGPSATQPAVNAAANMIYVPAQNDGLSLVIVDVAKREAVGVVPIGGPTDKAGGAVWDPATGLVWVVVESQGMIKSVDPTELRVVDAITVGEGPYGIALDTKLRRLYVTLAGRNELAVIDLIEKASLQPISVGAFPQGLSVDVESGRVFVANFEEGTISVIDGSRGEVIRTIPVGAGPGDAEYNPRNRLVYVPNGSDNSVSIVKPN